MKPQDLYDRLADLDEFENFHEAKPMAIAEAFRVLANPERVNSEADDLLCYDLARALCSWGFAGTQAEAVAYVSANEDPNENVE